MTISRRRFLGSSATTAVVAGATLGMPSPAPVAAAAPDTPQPATSTTTPSLAIIALNRMGFGPRSGDVAAFNALAGSTAEAKFETYVNQQLSPDTIDDSACDAQIAAARLKIKYDAASDGSYPAMHEVRALSDLSKSTSELWPLRNSSTPMAYAERTRPYDEVRVATWIRAVYSKRQLRELLADFWHNHFNINGSSESAIYATFPVYDRIIRANSLGNFRTFLEAVATSTAMMYYLDNYNNKVAGGEGGNENYARELFELHTLGSDNYLKFYDDRSNIGTITYDGKTYVSGYIDDDVYDSASCLTGWSINTDTGEYQFKANNHYNGTKEVLGEVLHTSDFATPEGEARKVFDLLAGHPATARSVCRKLCRRLISDTPPETVVEAATAVWMAKLDDSDQLKEVVRTILLSDEFKSTWGEKIKRPFEAVASYLRATSATLPIDIVDSSSPSTGAYWSTLLWNVDNTGHKLFGWPTPNGHPDVASYWASTNGALRRWNLPFILVQSWGGNVTSTVADQTNFTLTCTQIVDFWIDRLCGFTIDTSVRQELISFMAQGGDVDAAPQPTPKAPDWNKTDGLKERVRAMVQLIAACPDFHTR